MKPPHLYLACIAFPFRALAFVSSSQNQKRYYQSAVHMLSEISATTQGHMGVPEPLKRLEVAGTISIMGESTVTIVERLSVRPPVFIARNLLSSDDCLHIQTTVTDMEQGKTSSGNDLLFRPGSRVGWLSNQEDPVVGKLGEKVHSIFLPGQIYNPLFVEDLQVVKYAPGGEYLLHHDDKQRILTVLYYVNGVGSTWFPLCDYPTQYTSRLDAIQIANDMMPSKQGIMVSSATGAHVRIGQGDAIVFYNYFEDGTLDWNAIHAGLPGTEEKWVANHWFHRVPYGGL
jgi:2OG-Fe(II) oxygenase superfamily